MSATSGITVSPDLTAQFSSAVESKSVRFIKIVIQDESLVHDSSISVQGTLQEDLVQLQDVLEDNSPAYILAKLDDPPTEWLAIYYVPDSAKVRDKMLYASTRASLLKSLGSTAFTDSIFATSKSDLSPEAYAAHLKHIAAPKPLSAREQELADVMAAEREAGASYQGSSVRVSLVTGIGMKWDPQVETAVSELGEGDESRLVLIKVDTTTETLVLESSSEVTVDALAQSIPKSEPSYAFFAWPVSPSKRKIVFIYSCPSGSTIKHRMMYASNCNPLFHSAKTILASSSSKLAERKIETSDPSEVTEQFIRSEVGITDDAEAGGQKPAFAKPRGPKRR
ncbi:hypothetical protein C8J56DRAFT_959922 [Mycena floridula]|nr:hypothetical protein C8J56DRAFT_959922 [Mycena floridula]